jgi:acetyl esterase/lipase
VTAGTARRAVLRGTVLSGAALLASACSASAEEAAETPTPTGTPSTPERVDGAPTLPQGLQESQRTAYRYGEHPRQVADLWLPEGERRDGLVALVHGGAWQVGTDRSNVDNTVADLVGRGFTVLNCDYRGVDDGGGWTGTFTDVATALDQAAEAATAQGVDAARTLVLGHSAGGHLAMWAAARRRLPPLAASDPNVVNVFGGTPEEVGDRYAIGDPARLVALGMPLFVLHGTADDTVPPSQAQEFHDLAVAAGDQVDLQLVEGASHGDPLFPGEPTWGRALDWIQACLG